MNTHPADEYPASPMESEATRLMQATKSGDPTAFDRLVESLRGRAFSIAHSLVGSREDAMDLTQEAFLKTYRARETFRDGEPFLPWFHRILRNTCFSFLRRHRRITRISTSGDASEDEGDWEIADDGPPPSHALERAEAELAFWEGFRSLGSRDREILTLRHFRDLSYKEIAEAMDCPVGTVMSRLFHARRRLRERLASHLDLVSLEPERPPDATVTRGGSR